MRDDWLEGKWDDKKVIETAQELEMYLLHKYVLPELVSNVLNVDFSKNATSLAQKREDLQNEELCL